ncbi:hypothetical protein DDP39_03210 [Helicobacter pylori]|nr:hypothetical protein DDP41_04345 [Helicobacter pylori]RKU93313.1 hypothetical protein DDP39_03210 [Helicobacter pylori]
MSTQGFITKYKYSYSDNEVWAEFSDITFSVPSQKIESIEREVIEEREKHKIGSTQNLKINQIADDLKQGEVVSNKLIANVLVTQKAPSDTPHDDDLD